MPFEAKMTMPKIQFIEDVEAQFAVSQDPEASVQQAVDAASLVLTKLEEIENGTLSIEPPLSDEEVLNLNERAEIAVSIGNKAITALNVSESEGKKRRFKKDKKPKEVAAAPATFTGKGDSVKS